MSDSHVRCRAARAAAVAALLVIWPWVGRAEPPPAAAPRDDDVVARVNGTAIHRKAVRELVQGVLLAQDSAPNPSTVAELAKDALESLIDFELLVQDSAARGIVVSDADVDAELARARAAFRDRRAFAAALKDRGITEADLRRETRQTMAIDRLLEGTTFKGLSVPPDEVQRFYDENRDAFRHPAQVRLSHILVAVPEAAPKAERAKGRARADDLLAKLRAGAAFAALARAESADTATAAAGGDLGYVTTGELPAPVEQAAVRLEPGQLSDVIATSYGFQIITVTGRRGAGIAPFSEVQEQIRAVLLNQARQRRQAALVTSLRKTAKIEYGAPL